MTHKKTVHPPAAAATTIRPDAAIARDLRRELRDDFEVPDDRVAFKVINGTVVLTGTVQHTEQKAATAVAAARVKGVREVDNQIAVEEPVPAGC